MSDQARKETTEPTYCDCERSHNGFGMVGRLCDCQEDAVSAPLRRLRDLALADLEPMTLPSERTDIMMWAAAEIERLRAVLSEIADHSEPWAARMATEALS